MPPNKKKIVENKDSDTESETEGKHPDAYTGNEEIQVDFEGRNPIDSDFHGIRQLLQQLFLKAHINISEMVDLLINQNYIGSVVTQSELDDEEEDDEDDEDDMDVDNTIFGITSAINITSKKDVTCIQDFRKLILDKAEKNATENTLNFIRDILNNDARSVGFLINERFINIPAQISLPLMENLYKEIKRATEKKMPFDFEFFIMIIKFYRQEAKKNKPAEDIYSNQEEEVMCKEAIHSFDYTVETETDTGMSGDWLEGDSTLTPFRKVILFEANKLPQLILMIKEFINQ